MPHATFPSLKVQLASVKGCEDRIMLNGVAYVRLLNVSQQVNRDVGMTTGYPKRVSTTEEWILIPLAVKDLRTRLSCCPSSKKSPHLSHVVFLRLTIFRIMVLESPLPGGG
jgi:hypothetical protein